MNADNQIEEQKIGTYCPLCGERVAYVHTSTQQLEDGDHRHQLEDGAGHTLTWDENATHEEVVLDDGQVLPRFMTYILDCRDVTFHEVTTLQDEEPTWIMEDHGGRRCIGDHEGNLDSMLAAFDTLEGTILQDDEDIVEETPPELQAEIDHLNARSEDGEIVIITEAEYPHVWAAAERGELRGNIREVQIVEGEDGNE